jgi:hypothetical protein
MEKQQTETRDGMQTGPDIIDFIRRPIASLAVVLLAVAGTGGALAGMQDGPDGVDPIGRSGGYHANSTVTFGGTGFIDLGDSAPGVDRRCSLPGEMQQCEDYCGGVGGPSKPEDGWNPPTTALRSYVGTTTNPFRTYQMVNSCDVRTIAGHMTLVCTCFDPSDRT